MSTKISVAYIWAKMGEFLQLPRVSNQIFLITSRISRIFQQKMASDLPYKFTHALPQRITQHEEESNICLLEAEYM